MLQEIKHLNGDQVHLPTSVVTRRWSLVGNWGNWDAKFQLGDDISMNVSEFFKSSKTGPYATPRYCATCKAFNDKLKEKVAEYNAERQALQQQTKSDVAEKVEEAKHEKRKVAMIAGRAKVKERGEAMKKKRQLKLQKTE